MHDALDALGKVDERLVRRQLPGGRQVDAPRSDPGRAFVLRVGCAARPDHAGRWGLSISPGVISALAGSGYALTLLQRSQINSTGGYPDPTAAFSTRFPYAEAKVNLDLAASGGVQASFCVILRASRTFNFGSVDRSSSSIGFPIS